MSWTIDFLMALAGTIAIIVAALVVCVFGLVAGTGVDMRDWRNQLFYLLYFGFVVLGSLIAIGFVWLKAFRR